MESVRALPFAIFIRFVCLVCLCWWGVSGCSPADDGGRTDSEFHKMEVIILIPQTRKDDSWSAQGYDAAARIRTQLNARVRVVPESDPQRFNITKQKKKLIGLLDEGVDLVIGLGGQYETLLRELAEIYRYSSFAVVGEAIGNQHNFAGVSGRFDDLGYVMAELAVDHTVSDQPVLGFLGGIPFRNYQRMLSAYESRIYALRPEAEVMVDWVSSFADTDLSVKKARVLLEQGAEILLVNTGMGNQAIAELFKQYPERKLLLIDTEPRTEWNKSQVLATGTMDVAGIATHTAHQVVKGHWRGEQMRFSFDENVARISMNNRVVNQGAYGRIKKLTGHLRDGKDLDDNKADFPDSE
ncbi:BMP family ABC transporter substrate-binding protein [Oceanospirillum sediminis]|uniref:BMP family ABC transporter substrate-binding protein n=1 Tax=Oceanospirillum sediminis TaxID=2760088 RepID=A0A839ITA1_9GAMM|nr:BMP family ABC transporter substrate-binding protein [Oceanospirillum sediminis]MBB1487910.1 BMP family ABC transporter substrate-binding protein [Oceanospirillum sediminis]